MVTINSIKYMLSLALLLLLSTNNDNRQYCCYEELGAGITGADWVRNESPWTEDWLSTSVVIM